MPRQQRAVRTHALILRRRDHREADRLLTVITPEHGKFDVVAYGARKPNSRKTGHVELFTLADMLVDMHRTPAALSQVEMLAPYEAIRNDLTLGAYAAYAVELLDDFTESGDSDLHGLFELLRDTLARLCTHPEPLLVLRYYELHLLAQVGFQPDLSYCVLTGEEIQPQDQFFSFADGGIVSPEGARLRANLPSISFRALRVLRNLQRNEWNAMAALHLPTALHREMEALMLGYITYTLESQLQSVAFIRRVRQFNS